MKFSFVFKSFSVNINVIIHKHTRVRSYKYQFTYSKTQNVLFKGCFVIKSGFLEEKKKNNTYLINGERK